MSIAIVIVNFRTPQLVLECLKSIVDELDDLPEPQVYVVDNNSGDNSIELISSAITKYQWHNWVSVIASNHNGGFSAGNNLAIKAAFAQADVPEYVYLLNPDTLIHPGAISSLLQFMHKNNVGICGGAILGEDGSQQISARRFPSIWSELDSGARLGLLSKALSQHIVAMPPETRAHSCDWVSGASMLIHRSVIESIGLMDEGYFLYFEEMDYCFHAKQKGFEVWHVPDSVITHIEGAATGIKQKTRRGRYWYDSRRRYFIKTQGVMRLLAIDTCWALGRLSYNIRRLLRLGKKQNNSDPSYFAWDILAYDFYALLRGQFRRKKILLKSPLS